MENINILNQHIDDEEGIYRICVGRHVGYLTIDKDIFDEDTMCRPYLLIPKLPKLPEEGWTRINIKRASASAHSSDHANEPKKIIADDLKIIITDNSLPEIETVWHPQRIDVISLEQTKRHRSNVHEVIYNGVPAISKIAAFEWQVPQLERETWAYSILAQPQHPGLWLPQISPRVLGHLTECGRVIGLLLERLEGDFACTADLANCRNAVQTLHRIGLTHGDLNRYNFIINKQTRKVKMVDFEHASAFDEATAEMEIRSLASELKEGTGRGGPSKVVFTSKQ